MEASGVLIVNKPEGMTSHDVVAIMRRLFSTRRVGHTGTLDPMATGVLTVLIGRSAKATEYLSLDTKEYIATLRLGTTYDTEDITGVPLSHTDAIPDSDAVFKAIEKFIGEQTQIPPMYSALKVNGQKLCDLARKGIEVERAPRPITIFSIDAKQGEIATDYILKVSCSSGTYIRTLCADIGAALGCGGAMATLCRSRAGAFSLADAHSIDSLKELSEEERISLLRPTESLFYDLPALYLDGFYERLSRNGCEIYLKKIGASLPLGARVRLCSREKSFYALGEVREFTDGLAVKAIKLFDI